MGADGSGLCPFATGEIEKLTLPKQTAIMAVITYHKFVAKVDPCYYKRFCKFTLMNAV